MAIKWFIKILFEQTSFLNLVKYMCILYTYIKRKREGYKIEIYKYKIEIYNLKRLKTKI